MSALKRLQNAAADFTTPRLMRDPVEVTIPHLADDAEYAAAIDLLSAFERRKERLERDKQRITLERHLDGKTPDPRSSTDTSLRARLRALQTETSGQTSAAPTAPAGAPAAITAGLAVLSGTPLAPVLDHEAQIQEIDRQIAALRDAIREQTEVREEIADRLTLDYAQRLQPAWNQLQVEMYRAAQELARSTRRVREFRAKITEAGIRSRSDILAMPNVRAPLMLGDESAYDSEISGWRRILERLGILG